MTSLVPAHVLQRHQLLREGVCVTGRGRDQEVGTVISRNQILQIDSRTFVVWVFGQSVCWSEEQMCIDAL